MYKATAKNVKMLIKWGNEHAEISEMIKKDYQPVGHVNAYFMPSQANWAWQIGIYLIDGTQYELLTRFGSVEGGRQIYQVSNSFVGRA